MLDWVDLLVGTGSWICGRRERTDMTAHGELAEVTALDYVEPLRTGGSLPAVVETDDCGTYVVKFHAAAQGRKALVAEVIVGELARRLGLRVPELVLIRFDPAVSAHEPDQEVQDLHRASEGLNLGMDYLPGATDFVPGQDGVDLTSEEAGRVVWFDALVGNVDRTVRNPNLMVWHRRLWLIDHGAALIFHHRWEAADEAVAKAYDLSAHALGGYAPDVTAADAVLAPLVTEALLREVVAEVPDEWLVPEPGYPTPDALREAYVSHLAARVARSQEWVPRCFATPEELAAAEAAKRARTLAGRPAWLQHVRG